MTTDEWVASAPVSPNGGDVRARLDLHRRFASRLATRPLTRKFVSYQGNRHIPGFRWMRYKEGFSTQLVDSFLDEFSPNTVLDPFAGIGTTPIVAAGRGLASTGIEIMPVGVLTGQAIAGMANGVSHGAVKDAAHDLVSRVRAERRAASGFRFPHVTITRGAFDTETEIAIAKAREFLSRVSNPSLHTILNTACMTVLEEASFTRKDGQYLRWDGRANRTLRSAGIFKPHITPFSEAVHDRLAEMLEDMSILKLMYGQGEPTLVAGSCLELLKGIPEDSFDMVVTSPPYANRYDYTRTYALELAWLGINQEGFKELRQRMLSATVENRPKTDLLDGLYGRRDAVLGEALSMYGGQGALHEVLSILCQHIHELGNRHVIRLLEGYFLEMAVVVAELGRIVRSGGSVVMVNDNVQYHGEEVPVDLILSDFAEQAGFLCTDVWVLPRGKGNSSQQMGRFGRRELRKCIYKWVRR